MKTAAALSVFVVPVGFAFYLGGLTEPPDYWWGWLCVKIYVLPTIVAVVLALIIGAEERRDNAEERRKNTEVRQKEDQAEAARKAQRDARDRADRDNKRKIEEYRAKWVLDYAQTMLEVAPKPSHGLFLVPYANTIENPGMIVEKIAAKINDAIGSREEQKQYEENVRTVSRERFTSDQIARGKLVPPTEYTGSDIFQRYLHNLKGLDIVDTLVGLAAVHYDRGLKRLHLQTQ